MFEIHKYRNIVLDFDGVVVNSNFIKEEAIREASAKYQPAEEVEKFVSYFTGNNGIPREIKVNHFFSPDDSKAILKDYAVSLEKNLINADLTPGCADFLFMSKESGKRLFILSGGQREEVVNLLESKHLLSFFDGILGGPLTKIENLGINPIVGETLYIGDSKVDYEVAVRFGFDFIFMYGFTQFRQWKEFFAAKERIKMIKNFTEIM